MIISFAETTPALLAGVKTVTRRDWKPAHAAKFRYGELVDAWDKSPRNGGRKVAVIRLNDAPYPSSFYPAQDFYKEGLSWMADRRLTLFGGMRPWQLWEKWQRERPTLYVVRFELVSKEESDA